MGIFTVASSHKKILSHGETCEEGIKNNKKIIDSLITFFKRPKQSLLEEDYRKYKLRPTQQIRRRVRNSLLWHYGIYLFNGIIVEMGSAPKKCTKKVSLFNDISFIGLNTLHQFKKINPVYKVITKYEEDDSFKCHSKEILRRLRLVKKYLGPWDYNAITKNCKTFCNVITFGHEPTIFDNYDVVIMK
jgi:hypothetical protein